MFALNFHESGSRLRSNHVCLVSFACRYAIITNHQLTSRMYPMFSHRFVTVLFSIFTQVLLLTGTALAAPGDLDLTFGGTGRSRIGFGRGYDTGHATAVQSDGKLVMAG